MGFSQIASIVTTFSHMTSASNTPSPVTDDRPSYRLVVKARRSGQKAYVWEIVREDDNMPHPVSRSSGSYATMEEAYSKGSVALSRVRAFGAPARPG